MHPQIEREIEMDKFFRRGKAKPKTTPASTKSWPDTRPLHPDRPNRCRVLIARQPTLCMNLAHAEIRQTLVVEKNGKQGTIRVVLCQCPKTEAPERFQNYVRRWKAKESLL